VRVGAVRYGRELGLAGFDEGQPQGVDGTGIRTGLIAIGSAVLYFGAVVHLRDAVMPLQIPWWVGAIGFALAEVLVIHIQLRRDAHSFSMSEVPLALGLFFMTPEGLIAAQFVGGGFALAFHRKQSPIKLAFNMSHFVLEACLAVIVFHAIADLGTSVTPRDWFAAFAAAEVSTGLALLAIFSAVALSEGAPTQFSNLPRALLLGAITTGANMSLAILGVTVVWSQPMAIWLLVVPAVTLFIAYRAYISIQAKHESIEFLYESTRLLTATPEFEAAMVQLLAQTRKMFRAEVAQLSMLTNDGGPPLRTTLGPGDNVEVMRSAEVEPVGVFVDVLNEGRSVLLPRQATNPEVINRFPGIAVKDAMIAPLRGETRVLGKMIVVNRLGDVSTFDEADLKLFETLANHASVALENGRLEKSLAQVTELKERLRHQAFHDSLTGLANRVLFTDRVRHALDRSRRTSHPTSVLFVDLDDFKTVNDSLGHAAGDALLCDVARRLQQAVRPEDTVARLGGDEFAVLLEETALDEARVVAGRVLAALDEPSTIEGSQVAVHASVGVSIGSGPDDADELMRNADVAMYEAKQSGKGRFAVFEASMHEAAIERLQLTGDVRAAIDRHEFFLQYQPIFSLRDGSFVGVESLVRWNHPDRGIVRPDAFIPLAEETGLIHPIGRWVLDSACRQAYAWGIEHGRRDQMMVSINVSAKELQQPDLVDQISRALARSRLPASAVVIEITESVLLADAEGSLRRLRELKELGVRIALDDFGTGFSSLSYVQRLPIDILKIDKMFVRGVGGSIEDEALARAIIKLGQTFGLEVIAEGIENAQQVDRLRRLGCDYGQGFHLARPLDANGIGALLDTMQHGAASGQNWEREARHRRLEVIDGHAG